MHYRIAFVDLVPDALVVRDCDAIIDTAVFKPLFVRTVRRKQIEMPFDL